MIEVMRVELGGEDVLLLLAALAGRAARRYSEGFVTIGHEDTRRQAGVMAVNEEMRRGLRRVYLVVEQADLEEVARPRGGWVSGSEGDADEPLRSA